MSTPTHWDELNRSQQRLMIRLYGCGTVRNQDPEAIAHLYDCGFISDEGELTTLGSRCSLVPFGGNKLVPSGARHSPRRHRMRAVTRGCSQRNARPRIFTGRSNAISVIALHHFIVRRILSRYGDCGLGQTLTRSRNFK